MTLLKSSTLLSLMLASIATTLNQHALADSVSRVNCEALGDSVIFSSTGEVILEQRLVQFDPLEEYGLNNTGRRGGQKALCTVKDDPPGFRWTSCSKSGGSYVNYDNSGTPTTLSGVVQALPNSVQQRGWAGACLIKL